MSAQGNALGLRCARRKSPEGGATNNQSQTHHSSNSEVNEIDRHCLWHARALVVAPFQGSYVIVFRFPGLCPGLTCGCPLRGEQRSQAICVEQCSLAICVEQCSLATCVEQRSQAICVKRRSQATCVEHRGLAPVAECQGPSPTKNRSPNCIEKNAETLHQ